MALSTDVATGLNILKKGSDPPLKPDSELPDWLWGLAEPSKTLNELRRMKDEDLNDAEVRRGCTAHATRACMLANHASQCPRDACRLCGL